MNTPTNSASSRQDAGHRLALALEADLCAAGGELRRRLLLIGTTLDDFPVMRETWTEILSAGLIYASVVGG